jgi:type II secretory pathway pseudopilin PulG
MVRIMQTLRRRLQGEGGFTIVEAMISITILAVGAFAVAQASMFGLSTTGLSRQKLSSRAAVDQQMEEARALNYDNLVLSDSNAYICDKSANEDCLAHSTDPNNPDYYVDNTAKTFDPDGSGPLTAESLVIVPGASPALKHYQNPLVDGATTYEVYRYVTWYDSPQDGTGVSDKTDGNGDGVSDANGEDAKRVTVVVVWNDELGRGSTQLSETSLFSDGQILYKAPAKNNAPTVGCPTATVSDKTVSMTATASDADGSIASVTWNFGDGATGTGTSVTHTYAAYQTYTVVNSVTDNGGATASNSAAGCTVTTVNPVAGNGGPNGTVSINGGAAYTNSTTVTLTLAKSGGGPNPATMKFSNDNSTWLGPYAWATSYTWTLTSGDGSKSVYARYYDSGGLFGAIATDNIILDTTAPSTPTNFVKSNTKITGGNTTITFTWNAVTDSALGGYRVYKRLITSTGSYSLMCDTSSSTCSDTHKKTDTYEYYVVAYDLATNVSAASSKLTG